MHHPFPPLVLLVLAPALYLGARRGWFDRALGRWGLALLAGLVLIAGVRAGGMEFADLNRLKLGVALVAAALVLLRRTGSFGLERPRRYRVTLIALAGFAVIIHLNFFAFHGLGQRRVWLHLHDVAHYYLGAKYAAELGYADFYVGLLRAEAERFERRVLAGQARDLRTNRLVDSAALLADSDAVKAQFTPTRWAALQEDVASFRARLGPQYADIFRDHGYNPSPLWTLLGGALTNLVPAGSARGVVLLSLIDPVLLAVMFSAVAVTFGAETALLAIIYYCVIFGASFGWAGGAFARHVWLVAVVLSVCALARRRYAAAGAALALAALLRVFPALLAAGLAAQALGDLRARRSPRGAAPRFLAALLFTGALLVAATAARPRGLHEWIDFRHNLDRHMDSVASNLVGLTGLLAVGVDDSESGHARMRRIYAVQLLTVVPLALWWFVRRAQSQDAVAATAMGVTLLFLGLNLAGYYYVVLVLLLIAHRDRPDRIALLFAVEAATYALQLCEDREAVLFRYRDVLVLLLLAALYLVPDPGQRWRASRSAASAALR